MKFIRECKANYISTDCISCVFPNNFPFEKMPDNINIKGYYYDEKNKVPKYKFEIIEERLKVPKQTHITM